MENKINQAIEYATKKHEGQYRTGGKPYITHPLEVMNMLKERNYDINYQLVGLFHDLLEDTDATEEEILNLSNDKVLEATKLLTKTKGYNMSDYIYKIKNNPIAKTVKAMDRLHNLRCAVECNESFKIRYIKESLEWYLDFDKEILDAIIVLNNTLDNPLEINNINKEK